MTNAPLGGAELDRLLDRLEADLEEAQSGKDADLLARLRARPLHADTLPRIQRLHALWMDAGDPAAALAVVDRDGAAALAVAAPAERPALEMRLAACRLRGGAHGGDAAAMRATLQQMCALVPHLAAADAIAYLDWSLLAHLETGPLEYALDAIELGQALRAASEHRRVYRAYDLAHYHRRRAQAYARAQRHDEARQEAGQAVAALRQAAPDQDVEVDDWQSLGDALIEIAPERLTDFEQAVRAGVRDWALPRQREEYVRLARLAARAAHAQGDLKRALALCENARYNLDSNCGAVGDDFIEYQLPWLSAAGRNDEAGQRAFFHIHEREENMWPGAAKIVHEHLARADDASVWWALCVMRVCHSVETLTCFLQAAGAWRTRSAMHAQLFAEAGDDIDEAARHAVYAAAKQLAQARSPDHPWMRRMALSHDEETGQISAATAAQQMHELAGQFGMSDWRTQYRILCSHTKAEGFSAAIHRTEPQFASGLHTYVYGNMVQALRDEALGVPPDGEENKDWMCAIEVEKITLEQGIARYEHYFETGHGHPYDGSAHVYSMICNNLAIIYRYSLGRYEDAISLHEKGIQASPFAEHYGGILWARINLQDWPGIIEAAEQLWQFAAQHGYSRHNPNGYAEYVAEALHKTDRHQEIPIWLERLASWQRQSGEKENALSDEALNTLLMVSGYMLANEGRALWQRLEPQVRVSRYYLAWLNAGWAAHMRGDDALAIELYQKGNALNPADTPLLRAKIEEFDKRIADLQGQLREQAESSSMPKKSWWKIW